MIQMPPKLAILAPKKKKRIPKLWKNIFLRRRMVKLSVSMKPVRPMKVLMMVNGRVPLSSRRKKMSSLLAR